MTLVLVLDSKQWFELEIRSPFILFCGNILNKSSNWLLFDMIHFRLNAFLLLQACDHMIILVVDQAQATFCPPLCSLALELL